MRPPEREDVPTEVFETFIEMIEHKLGLADQPRTIIFLEGGKAQTWARRLAAH